MKIYDQKQKYFKLNIVSMANFVAFETLPLFM